MAFDQLVRQAVRMLRPSPTGIVRAVSRRGVCSRREWWLSLAVLAACLGVCTACGANSPNVNANASAPAASAATTEASSSAPVPCTVTDPLSSSGARTVGPITQTATGPRYDIGPFNVTFGSYQQLPSSAKPPLGNWSHESAYGSVVTVTNTTTNIVCWGEPQVSFVNEYDSQLAGTPDSTEYATPDGAIDTDNQPIGPGQSVQMFAVYDGSTDPSTLTSKTIIVQPSEFSWGAPGQGDSTSNFVDLSYQG